jgi:CRISPR-associated endonuclease Cas2
MYYCVTYDISSAQLRRQVVKALKMSGLCRLQKSVFAGTAARAALLDIEQAFIIASAPNDKLCLIPLDQLAWNQMRLTGDTETKNQLTRSELIRYF